MQEVNAAYTRRDLLALLELRLRFEHLAPTADPSALGATDPATHGPTDPAAQALADARLAHFNRLLTEQAHQLQHELTTLEAPWRHQLDLSPRAKLTPAIVIARLTTDLSRLTAAIAQLRNDLTHLTDLDELRAWLRAAQRTADRIARPP